MTLINCYSIIARLFIALVLIDFDGDFLLRQESGLLKLMQDSIRYGIVFLLLSLFFLGVYNITSAIKIKSSGFVCLGAVFLAFMYGLIVGLLRNSSDGAIREFAAIAPLCLIPILLNMEREKLFRTAKYFMYLLVFVVAVKILLSQLVHFYIYGILSWKVILRSSPLLLLPYIYFLLNVIRGGRRNMYIFLLFVVTIEVFVAQARALNVALLLATLIILVSVKRLNRGIFTSIFVLGVSALAAIFFTDGSLGNIFGLWSGENFNDSSNYRLEQLTVLFGRYFERPLAGFGFGYYTIGYLTYGELVNSFLLELDLINFSTKIGIPIFGLYVLGYMIFVLQYMNNEYHEQRYRLLDFSYLLALVLLLFYSLFQTAHSSILYWLLYALSFSLIFKRNLSRMQ